MIKYPSRKKEIYCLFTKTPGLTPLKTRLGLHSSTADHIYELSVFSILLELLKLEKTADIMIYTLEPYNESIKYWKKFLNERVKMSQQKKGSLGEKLSFGYNHFIKEYEKVFLLGGDSPLLSKKKFEEASYLLDHSDFFLGPAVDGGFYLFGGKCKLENKVWTSVEYSSPTTLSELEINLRNNGSLKRGGFLNDMDVIEDIQLIKKELEEFNGKNIYQKQLLEKLNLLSL